MPPSARDSAYSRAFALRDRFTERELPIFEATYYFSGPGRDREKAIAIYDRMLLRGDTAGVLANLSILVSNRREFARAETLYRARARQAPGGSLEGLWGILQRVGKWAESDSVLTVGLARFPGNSRYRELKLEQLLRRGEWDAYRKSLDSALRSPDPRNPSGAALRAAGLGFAEARLRDADALLAEAFRIDSMATVPRQSRYVGSHEVLVPAMARTETPLVHRIAAQLPHAAELWAYESQLDGTSLSDLADADAPFTGMAEWLARAGSVTRAREAMDQYRREVTDTAVLRVRQPDVHAALGEIASAEGLWEEAVREMRLADTRPDGPVDNCDYCLSLKLFRVFATAGMSDSALAQYEAYRRTTNGSRPRSGPDPSLAAPALEAIGRMYEERGDTTRAVEAYRDFVARWKRADPEFHPRVAAARRRIDALTQQERPKRQVR
jgi:tetratricopeptide (TPR) repeat protein